MKRWTFQILFILICIFLPLVAGELFLRVLIPTPATEQMNFHTKLTQLHEKSREPLENALMPRLIAHPYWGHQLNPNYPGVNNFGFLHSEDLPYARKKNEFVVGLFGASVATYAFPHIKDALEKTTGLKCGRRLKLLNFANEGYRQPSQTHIATFFIDNIDAAINLDGNNEINGIGTGDFPANYPYFTHEMYFLTTEKQGLLKKALSLEKRRERLARLLLALPWSLKSTLVYFLSSQLEAALEAQQNLSMDQLMDSTPKALPNKRTRSERMFQGVLSWRKYTEIQNNLTHSFGVPSYFFIQPSQYSPDGKTWSEEETRKAQYKDAERTQNLKQAFQELRKAGQALKSRGVDVIDFMSLFSQNPETIFVDRCCHLNDLGNGILADKMALEIVARINKLPCKQ